MLALHRLRVYQKALGFCADAGEIAEPWGSRHAIRDQFRRASESILLNLAEAARLRSPQDKASTLDYALGSTLECAACLDIALIQGRSSPACVADEKDRLLEIARMLIGLRKAWLQGGIHEEPGHYEVQGAAGGTGEAFHHESLDVYRAALDFMRWFVQLPGGIEISDRVCREVDKAGTGMILNIAEGNGRYSTLDHRRFVEMASASAVKAGVYLDLLGEKGEGGTVDVTAGRLLLGRILAMLAGF